MPRRDTVPIVSKAQQGFLFAKHPQIAKRWAKHTPNMKDLPEHVGEKKAGIVDRLIQEPKPGLLDSIKTYFSAPVVPTRNSQAQLDLGGVLKRMRSSLPSQLGGSPGAVSDTGRWGALGALGLGGYGLYRMGSRKSKPREKEAMSKLNMDMVKRAFYVRRHNAAAIVNHYLDKLAEDAPRAQEHALRIVQASLILGDGIHQAVYKAFPKMAADKRGKLGKMFVKKAAEAFNKAACSGSCPKTTRKEFHGPVKDGHAWMKANS